MKKPALGISIKTTPNPRNTMTKEYPVCRTCRSEEVVVDAWAEWDRTTQQMILQNTFDNAFCNTCEEVTSLDWIEYD